MGTDDSPEKPQKEENKPESHQDEPLKLPSEVDGKYSIPEIDQSKQEKLRSMPKEAREALRQQVLQLIEQDDVLGIMGEGSSGDKNRVEGDAGIGGGSTEASKPEKKGDLDNLFSPMPSKGKGDEEATVEQDAAEAPGAQKEFGSIQCYSCQGEVPILSEERPLIVKCPSCGTEGMIGEDS